MAAPLIILTGLPGTGKTTLARALSAEARWPLLAKDDVKEALSQPPASPAPPAEPGSRALSDASFAVLFRLAPRLLDTAPGLILEGNFRAGEHEPWLATVGAARPLLQVLCRLAEPERQRRLRVRAPQRHGAHAPGAEAARPPECDRFLELPGARLLLDTAHPLDIQLRELRTTVCAHGSFALPGA